VSESLCKSLVMVCSLKGVVRSRPCLAHHIFVRFKYYVISSISSISSIPMNLYIIYVVYICVCVYVCMYVCMYVCIYLP